MHFTARPFTVKAREPGLRTGLSFPPEKGTRGAGLSRGAGRGLTRIAAPEPPLTPAPPHPRRVLPQGRPMPLPAPAPRRASSCLAAPPRLAARGLSLTVGFYLQPAALSAPAPDQPQPAPEEEDEPGAGRATLADPRGGRGASGEGPARAVSTSARASERGVGAPAAAVPK